MRKVQFTLAEPTDEPAVKDLLSKCELPHGDISAHLKNFILAKSGSELVGVVGLETLGQIGLLRSLAVEASHRGKGLAERLCKKIEDHASAQGIKELYLLTLTAEDFFKKLDYHRVGRTQVPRPVQHTKEFSGLCPVTSACMVKVLKRAKKERAHRHRGFPRA